MPDDSWIIGSLLEGMWISRPIMNKIYTMCATTIQFFDANVDWMLDEVLIPTLVNLIGNEQAHGEPYNAYVHADGINVDIKTVDKIIKGEPTELYSLNCWNSTGTPILTDTSTKYSIKRFPRDIDHPVRQHVIRATGLDIRSLYPPEVYKWKLDR